MYMNEGTMKALLMLHKIWVDRNDGPLVTMDAGSNIHLLFRPDQGNLYLEMIAHFQPEVAMWTDEGYLAKI